MHSTLSQSLAGLALISSAFASPFATAPAYNGTIAPSPTGTYPVSNGTNGTYGTSSDTPPPAYAVTPVPIESFVPGPCLQPATHWDHPTGDLQQLAPTSENSLYYASNGTADPNVEHMFASLNTTSNYSAVVLGHSSYVQSVSCAADGMLITFTDAEGFNFAANAWPQQGTDFVLVTYTDGCGNSTDQRTFWLIDSLSYLNETNAIDAKVTRELGVEDMFSGVHMVWGKYTPAQNATAASKRGLFSGLNNGDKTVTASANINLAAPTNDPSPWGGAALLFEEPGKVSVSNKSGSAIDTDFKIFCVNCGIQSHFELQGEAGWQYLPPKITKLTAEIDANIVANFHLGMVATAEFDETKTKNLFNQAVPDLGFSVGGIFDAGVYVTVDAVANLDITAEGQAMAGVTMTIPNFKANLDMMDENSGSNSKVTGLTPQWEKTFDVAGALGAKASLALPIGLHLGIKIKAIFDKSVALIEQPSLTAQAQIAGSIGGAAVPGVTCNDGVSYSIDAHNDISLNLFDVKTFNLEHADWPILSGCKQLPHSSTVVTSTTEAPKSTKPADAKTTTTGDESKPTATGTGHFPTNSANATVPVGTGHSKTLVPTGTGAPVYGGSNNTLHTTVKGTGSHSAPKPTGTGDVPVYGGHNETVPTYHQGTGVSTRPEATATHHSSASVPVYGGKNSTATETSKSESKTTAAPTEKTSAPVYGAESSSTTAAATEKTASTTAAPGYGASASSTFATVTKPAAESTTTAPGKYGQAPGTITSSVSTKTSTSSSSSSSSTDTCTDELKKTSTKAASTTEAPKTTDAAKTTTKAAKTTSKKIGY